MNPRRPATRLGIAGLRRAAFRGIAALALGLAVYVALVQLDLVRSPLDPVLRGDIGAARSEREGLRVLFVGNSLTFENDMPSLLSDLAASNRGGPTLFVASYTAPGWSLRAASGDDGLHELLQDVPWDVIVLQEASRIPSLPSVEREAHMRPYASALARNVRSSGARPALFMTWAYRDGDDRASETDTFAAMQARLVEGYGDEGAELAAPVVPVGLAWAAALEERPELELWSGDGKHPSRLGSYLAACSFYVALTGEDATGIDFDGGLSAGDAALLRHVATVVVTNAEARGALSGTRTSVDAR